MSNMNNKRCIIIGAGQFSEDKIPLTDNDYIIAADGGYNYAMKLGIKPDLLIGDFDSLSYIPKDIMMEKHPAMKDDTDMMLAVKKAISLGYGEIELYGALGGDRIDHSLANIAILKYCLDKDVKAVIKDKNLNMIAIRNSYITINGRECGYISIFAMDNVSSHVTIKGLKYEIEDATLYNSIPLGVSNEFVGRDAYIEVLDGTLLIVY